VGGDRADFFVSHAGADRAWAEWVAWQLTDAGYTVVLDVWDWAAGKNFITAMSDALERCDRVVALFSMAYFDRSRYTAEEWSASLVYVPGTDQGRLVPVRIEDVPAGQVPAVLTALVHRDLFGLAEGAARKVLLEAVHGPSRPVRTPLYPGHGLTGRAVQDGAGPRMPGTLPPVWDVPPRNAGFTGRDGLLVAVREKLLSGDRAVVQALHGMGGVGKTQLAVEYAHRFASAYDIVWWVPADQPELIMNRVAALAIATGCAQADTPSDIAAHAALAELRGRSRWLLVFDNAETARDLVPWLPGGSAGHVLVTTRTGGWQEVAAVPVEVNVFARSESVAILSERVPGLPEADADSLAAGLGDLPLAIAQAAGYMAGSRMPAAEYLQLVKSCAARILDEGHVPSYPETLAGAVQLSAQRLAQVHAAAAQMARICAFLASEPIPLTLFTDAAGQLPEPLSGSAADPLAWRKMLAAMNQSALARVEEKTVHMHRLTQAILRDRLSPAQAAATRTQTEAILAVSDPGDPSDPVTWPRWAGLMPHLLAAAPAVTDSPALRVMTCNACEYLVARGDPRTALSLASDLLQGWRRRLGSDDEHTLEMAHYLGWALRDMGCYAEARDLHQDTLARKRRILGEDHPSTLITANNLAADLRDLGELPAARDLAQDTLDRRRRVLGEDHLETLFSANNLAVISRRLGEPEIARDLNQRTLDRKRRILGDNRPSTLMSAHNLAADLRDLGELPAARDLAQDTLNRRRQVLGEDHPDTLRSASNLAAILRRLGKMQAARDLAQDTLNRRRRVLGEDHPLTRYSAGSLASDLEALDET
jgi:hypothetical protein